MLLHRKRRLPGLLAGSASALALAGISTGLAANFVVNGDFEVPERAYVDSDATSITGQFPRTALPGWILDELGEQFIVSDVEGFGLLDGVGGTVARFSENDDGFGDNSLEQVITLSGDDERFSFQAAVTSPHPKTASFESAPLSVRLRVRFYASEADAEADDNRLGQETRDFDLVLDEAYSDQSVDGDEALAIAAWEWADAELSGSVPAGTQAARIRISTRDRTDGGSQADGSRIVFFDNLRLSINGGDNLVANGDFADFSAAGDSREAYFNDQLTPFEDDDQGPFAWQMTDIENDSVDEEGNVPAAVLIPNRHLDEGTRFEAVSGQRVFRFTNLGTEFGDDTLEQCVDLRDIYTSGEEDQFNLGVWARTDAEMDQRRIVRLSYDFFDNAEDCLNYGDQDGDGAYEYEFDYALPEANQWRALTTSVTAVAGDNVGAATDARYARISLRAIDPDEDGISVFFDAVSALVLGEPRFTFEGDDEENPEVDDTIRVEIEDAPADVTLYYSWDGTDPDPETAPSIANGATVNIPDEDAEELRVKAFKQHWTASGVATYELGTLQPEPETGTPAEGSRSTGTVGCSGGPVDRADPLFPLLVAGGAAWLLMRRRSH